MFAPSQVRGLKPADHTMIYFDAVRTFTGAWIETVKQEFDIEITRFAPSQVRGLKLLTIRRGLYNIVRTFTGAWIETSLDSGELAADHRSHLHRCVD